MPNSKSFYSLLDKLKQNVKEYNTKKANLALNFFFKFDMIYGLQNNIFEAPYSLIVSILIFLGIFYVGHLAIIFFLKLFIL